MSRKGPTPRKPTPRTLPGIPGTVEPGYREQPIEALPLPRAVVAEMERQRIDVSEIGLARYKMGACNLLLGREPAGANRELLWHLTISTPSRHPTWDEIKTARYRLLPPELTFALLLPPPADYVNVPEQDHVFQLWECHDPRKPWGGA